jgi:hypothetical protein
MTFIGASFPQAASALPDRPVGYSRAMDEAAPERPRRRFSWQTVAAVATATLVLGGFLGYVIGRPNTSPPVHGALRPGQVRVPDLRNLDTRDVRAILGPLDLQVGAIGLRQSQDLPRGIVLEQDPPGGSAAPAGQMVDLVASSGPGPGATALYEFDRSVLVPLTHTGTYAWTSDPIALDGEPVSFGANTRVIGRAAVSPYRITRAPGAGSVAVTVSVDVSSFEAPAWFVIERAFARQRETTELDPGLTARPSAGPPGTEITLEGHHCQAAPAGTSVAVSAEFSRDGKPYATDPLPVRGAAYAFRMTFTVPDVAETPTGSNDVHRGDEIAFATTGSACRSEPVRVG